MILRAVAATALVLGAALTLLFLHVVGKAPWSDLAARHLRDMKDRDTEPESTPPITIAELVAMPRRASVAEYSGLERRGASLEGWVQRIVRATDGDLHLDVVGEPIADDGDRRPYMSAEITPAWARGSARWQPEPLAALFRPLYGEGGHWEAPPRRVRLSGWLLYDFQYEGARPRPGNPPRTTVWEIHPVTKIEAWDDSTRGWVEYAR